MQPKTHLSYTNQRLTAFGLLTLQMSQSRTHTSKLLPPQPGQERAVHHASYKGGKSLFNWRILNYTKKLKRNRKSTITQSPQRNM